MSMTKEMQGLLEFVDDACDVFWDKDVTGFVWKRQGSLAYCYDPFNCRRVDKALLELGGATGVSFVKAVIEYIKTEESAQ